VQLPFRSTLTSDNIALKIRNIATSIGVVEFFRVYTDSTALSASHREGLQKVGVEIIDVPHFKSSMFI
jgi:hypothetical protein